MSDVASLLARLAAAGIRLTAEGDALRVHAPRGALDEELTAAIRERKQALLRALSRELSHAQRRLFFLERLHPGAALYVVSVAFHVRGPIGAVALGAALEDVVARHESLRSTFTTEDGRPVVRIAAPGPVPFARRAMPNASLDDLRQEAQAFARRAFDVSSSPLLRALLLVGGEREAVLAVAVHHLVFDAWSGAVFARDLGAAYAARHGGSAPVFEPLAASYDDFASEQHGRIERGEHAAALARIAARLAGVAPALELPIDRPRPRTFTTAGATHAFLVPRASFDGLRAFGRTRGATSFAVLLAAFGALLHRATLADRFVVGTPTSGRTRRELEAVVGLFADLAPVVVDARGRPTFEALVDRVRDDALAALDDADVPFDCIVEALKPPRDPSRPPLVDVGFAYQNAPRASVSLDDVELAPLALDSGTARFDLLLTVVEPHAAGDHVEASFEYRTDLFDAATIARLAAAFVAMLDAAALRPSTALAELPTGEVPRVDAPATVEDAPLVHEAFEAHADRAPDAPAITFGHETVSYGALDARATRIARALEAAGVRERIAVCVEPSVDLVASLLAIAKLGATAVPLDPEQPALRLCDLAREADVAAVLVSGSTRASFAGVAAPVVALDDEALVRQSAARLIGRAPRAAAAYVMFTSGSTGTPKGVVVSYASVARLFAAGRACFEFRHDDTWALLHSVAFDFSVWEIWGALAHGARLVVVPRDVVRTVDALWSLLVRERVTVLNQTPSAFRALMAIALRDEAPGALRTVVFGGEALDVGALAPWFARFGDERPALVNMYGITEITVHATFRRIDARTAMLGRASPIGGPWPDLAVFVGDEHGRPVADGFPGEIVVAGAGVADGYFRDEPRTSARFFAWNGTRAYRSGDLGRRAAGELYCLGRRDAQVKLRGHRIELGEIEAMLARHPAVAHVAVVLRQTPPFAGALVAYVVARDGALELDDVRAFARARLPRVMVPSAFVVVPELPRGANGKLDRDRLPAPAPPRHPRDHGEVRARSPRAAAIAAVWSEVLGIADVPHDETFFDLGGSSLRLVEVQARLEAQVGVRVPLVELFEFPTVAALAAHLDETPHVAPAPPARAANADEPIAIVGMAARFPGAPTLEAYWALLRDGRSATRELDDAALDRAGVPVAVRRDERYVRRANVVEDADAFDAAFFGYSPKEAALLDPQQRAFLECAWHALEDAGLDPRAPRATIGLFAGASLSRHMLAHVDRWAELARTHGDLALLLANDKDYVATRVAYELDLRGPVMTVQTACSTSLVAVHQAAAALARGECDVAIAGGVSIDARPPQGYLHREGGIASPDGLCRAFDDAARGTAPGGGCGAVVLKRLSDARASGDAVWAVLRGSAVDNDGHDKVGFTAPSVSGQARVIGAALAAAGVSARSIGYVEGHGTATPMGDPVEIAALTRAFRAFTPEERFCGIGSVKSNIGHADAAAGVAGFIKAVLAVHHGVLPPTLHVTRESRALAKTPFYAVTQAAPWSASDDPRRAAVSSFGLGGTNAHAIVEEAPPDLRRRASPARTVFRRTRFDLPPRAAGDLPRRPEREFFEAATWARSVARPRAIGGALAIFAPHGGAAALEAALRARAHDAVAKVFPASDVRDLESCVRELRARSVDAALRLIWLATPLDGTALALEDAQRTCLLDPIALARAWTADPAAPPLDLTVVACGTARVRGDEGLAPAHALARGLALTLPLELRGARVRLVDVDRATDATHLAAELASDVREPRVALRGGTRWIPTREPLDADAMPAPPDVRGRTAWVIGGLGDIGVACADELAARGASVVLLGRTKLPPVDQWPAWLAAHADAPGARAMRRILERAATDARVAYATCDVTDERALGALLTEAPLGAPSIVVFAAGRGGGGLAVRRASSDVDAVLERARGALALVRAFADRDLDAFVLASALSAHVGAVGQIDVIAASAVVEAIAEAERARRGDRVVTAVAWPAWKSSRLAAPLGERFGIDDDEGRRAFARMLAAPAPCVTVSPEPLDALAAAARLDVTDALAHVQNTRSHEVPTPADGATEADLDAAVAAAFASALGMGTIDPNIDFFDLGGDSMLALAAVADLEARLGRRVPASVLVTGGTIRSVAQALARTAASASAPRVVELRAGTMPPIVLLHAASGAVSVWRDVVARLAPGPAVLGLASPLLGEPDPTPRSIEALARAHADALLAHAPALANGAPFVVAGWSFGGLVAFELARVLSARGARALVVVVDMTLRPGAASRAAMGELMTALPRVEAAHRAAMVDYRPAPAEVPVTLVKARSGPFASEGDDRSWGWDAVAPSPHVVEVDADHDGALRGAAAEVLAALLVERLR